MLCVLGDVLEASKVRCYLVSFRLFGGLDQNAEYMFEVERHTNIYSVSSLRISLWDL